MRRGLVFLIFFSAIILLLSHAISAQTPTGTKGRVVIAKLSAPIYPTIARTAHISGEVHLSLGIRLDGSIESAMVTSGPPLLREAALNSAHGSQYECRGCSEVVTEYSLVYAFQLGPGPDCEVTKKTPQASGKQQSYPQVIQSENHVTVVDQTGYCDPIGMTGRKVRAAKCLYLWECGIRWSASESESKSTKTVSDQ